MYRENDAYSWSNNYFLGEAAGYGYEGLITSALSSSAFKLTTARVGDIAAAQPTILAPASLLLIGDEAGDGIGLAPGNPTINVGDAVNHYATINTNGDQDFFQ